MSVQSPVTSTYRSPRWGLVALGFAFSILTAVALGELLQSAGDWNSGFAWEQSMLRAIPTSLPPVLDWLFLTLPWLSSNTVVLPLVIVGCLWLWRVRGRLDLAVHMLVVDLGTFVFTPLLKTLYDRPRPALWEHRGQYAWSSFPSGHAIIGVAVFATIAVIAYREHGKLWPAAVLGVMLAVSLCSRLYLGVHWPTDVIAGALIGAVWLGFTLRAFPAGTKRSVDDRAPNS
ncbi:MAG TPA: phosphatase PAP2 family protein [Gemmatimonadaceae bacterium]|nr:phosphatase PAP2 family protein [Gemmatimonadaceae bacterium]